MKLSPPPKRRLKRHQRCPRAESKLRTSWVHKHPFSLNLSLSPRKRERRRPVRHKLSAHGSPTGRQRFSFSRKERAGGRGKAQLKELPRQKLICGRRALGSKA